MTLVVDALARPPLAALTTTITSNARPAHYTHMIYDVGKEQCTHLLGVLAAAAAAAAAAADVSHDSSLVVVSLAMRCWPVVLAKRVQCLLALYFLAS